jgi:hypothetical protein
MRRVRREGRRLPVPQATTEGHQCVTATIFWMKTPRGMARGAAGPRGCIQPRKRDYRRGLEARIREIDSALPQPMLEWKPDNSQ